MLLTDAPEIAEQLTTGPVRIQWDAGNTEKLAKHKVSTDEVEALFATPFVLAGRIVSTHAEDRYLALGVSAEGRRLAVIFTMRDESLRPISCRAMRKKEKGVYEEEINRV